MTRPSHPINDAGASGKITGGSNSNSNSRGSSSSSSSSWTGFHGHHWQVHKFGGTSVANASCFRLVSDIVLDNLQTDNEQVDPSLASDRLAIVVSAMGGKPKTTDLLLQAVRDAAERNDASVQQGLQFVRDKHLKCLHELFANTSPSTLELLQSNMETDLRHIQDILKTVSLMMWPAQRILELVSGYGELWSTQILTHLLNQRLRESHPTQGSSNSSDRFVYVDARTVVTIDEESDGTTTAMTAAGTGPSAGGAAPSSSSPQPQPQMEGGPSAGTGGIVMWDMSSQKLEQLYHQALENETHNDGTVGSVSSQPRIHLVMTGYVACNTKGVATTLQRDGSDYSASILGRLLRANQITIWTDVSGVLTADPRRVPLATVVPEISYNEAQELAYFGSKVIHPKTMQPAIQEEPQIPIYIRNTFEPRLPGTRIYLPDKMSTSSCATDKVVCGFSTVENMALVNVEGSGMMGVPGVATRIFATLKRNSINVVLISQASSEHSVTFCCVKDHADLAKRALEDEFRRELDTKRIESVDIRSPCSIIAAVGDGMALTSGVSGRFFSALGDAKINVHAIAQGSSERNISAVVWSHESTRALRAVHAAFSLSYSSVRVAILGMTAVGESLLKLLETQRAVLRANFDIDVQVCVVLPSGSSSQMVCLQDDHAGDAHGVNTGTITMGAFAKLARSMAAKTSESPGVPHASFHDEATSSIVAGGGVDRVAEQLFRHDCTTHVVFDCTNDEAVSKYHASWLRSGIDVVTANNTGLSGPEAVRKDIKEAERALGKQSAKYLRQVTVAGGLPVLSTLKSLLNSGDVIRRIDGLFTVVLSYVLFRISPPPDVTSCSTFDMEFSNGAFVGDLSPGAGAPGTSIGTPCSLSQAIQEAIALGLTEEDPTTDLNNEYTARVLMVLARELGMDDDNDVSTIQQASDTLWDFGKAPGISMSHELSQLLTPEMDQKVKDRVDLAQSRGCVLRSISSIDVKSKRIEIKLVEVPTHHVFAVTPPSCSCVRFFTKRHRTYPLIIQGPAAGADSTASALLAELLQRTKGLSNTRTLALTREGSGAFLNRLVSSSTASPAVSTLG